MSEWIFTTLDVAVVQKHKKRKQKQTPSKLKTCVFKDAIKKWKIIHRLGENIFKSRIWERSGIQTIYRTCTTQQQKHSLI